MSQSDWAIIFESQSFFGKTPHCILDSSSITRQVIMASTAKILSSFFLAVTFTVSYAQKDATDFPVPLVTLAPPPVIEIADHAGQPGKQVMEPSVQSLVDTFPGTYSHFDLMKLLDEKDSSDGLCPKSFVFGPMSIVDNHTAAINYTKLFPDGRECKTISPATHKQMKFHRVHIDMMFQKGGEAPPKASKAPAPSNETATPLTPFIEWTRQQVDNSMFKWFADIPDDKITCGTGGGPIKETNFLLMDAPQLTHLLLDSLLKVIGKGRADHKHEDGSPKESMHPGGQPKPSEDKDHDEMPAAGQYFDRGHLQKLLKGRYFFSLDSERISCIYVKAQDKTNLENLLKKLTEEEKKAEMARSISYFKDPVRIEARAICSCAPMYPKNIVILPPRNDTNGTMPQGPGRMNTTVVEGATEKDGMNKSMVNGTLEGYGKNMAGGPPTPRVFFDGQLCKAHMVKPLPQLLMGSMNGSHKKEMNDPESRFAFMIKAIVMKYYQEVTGDQGQVKEKMPFEAQMKIAFHLIEATRNYTHPLIIPGGSRCGDLIVQGDTLLLIDHRHIFDQLSHLPLFKLLNKFLVTRLQSFDDSLRKFTVHVFSQTRAGFHSCSYASSEGAISLISTHCTAFRPLGYMNKTQADRKFHGEMESPESSTDHEGKGVNGNATDSANESVFSSMTVSASGMPMKTVSPSAGAQKSMAPTPSASSTPSVIASTGSNSGTCFPGAAFAMRADGRMVRMDELVVGDCVRDRDGGFSTVLAFTHKRAEEWSEFIRLETAYGALVVSPLHYVYVGDRVVTAESVKVGDLLQVSGPLRESRRFDTAVLLIERVVEKGLFNPLTSSGSIGVVWDGFSIAASCFTAVVDASVSSVILGPLRWLDAYLGITVPFISHLLRDGSEWWLKVLPRGETSVTAMTELLT